MKRESLPQRGHRLWFLAGIGVLVGGAVLAVQFQPEMERNFKTWLTAASLLAGSALSAIWFLLLSRFPWRYRLIGAGVMLAAYFGLKQTVKVQGTSSGVGLPRLVFRWSSPSQANAVLPQTTAASIAAAAAKASDSGIRDVPQFFGPRRDGVVHGARLSHDWTATSPRLLWRQPIGAGWSAFSVVGQNAYTQEQSGENELISCLDVLTGRRIWSHTNSAHFSQWQGGDGPRATPCEDRGQIFAIGATGILDCLNASTGRLIWSREVLKENKLSNLIWGVSCSPLVTADSVIVTGGSDTRATVLAYRRQTGEPLWQAGTDKASYASPMLASISGKDVVLSVNAASLTAHDPLTGEVLLDYPWSNDKWPKASEPVLLDGDRIFLSAGYGVGCVMLKIKATSGGKLTATELWKNKMMKTQFNSAAVRGQYIYGLDDGLLACVDADTGTRKWKDGHYGSGQSLLVDDAVIIQAESGEVVLAKADPAAFVELGKIPALHSKTWNHPTLAGHYLLVRNDVEAACYELPIQTENPATANK